MAKLRTAVSSPFSGSGSDDNNSNSNSNSTSTSSCNNLNSTLLRMNVLHRSQTSLPCAEHNSYMYLVYYCKHLPTLVRSVSAACTELKRPRIRRKQNKKSTPLHVSHKLLLLPKQSSIIQSSLSPKRGRISGGVKTNLKRNINAAKQIYSKTARPNSNQCFRLSRLRKNLAHDRD